MSNLNAWEAQFKQKVKEFVQGADCAHDYLHFHRVVNTAKKLAERERAEMAIVVPAAWLHDFVIVAKDSPLRNQASKLSAEAAVEYLASIGYAEKYLREIYHAIEAHSFSANIPCETLEAKIVQDADRLDALGAIGVARCFATGGVLGRPLYAQEDPLCEKREANDRSYTLDHFYQKLFKVAESLHTSTARQVAQQRVEVMKDFVQNINLEIHAQA
ncbi:MAG: HD domain-containing protein [Bdellovibrionales bacterium]|nr:HD domain-containing protein [Bdellovibrionales bacterium]